MWAMDDACWHGSSVRTTTTTIALGLRLAAGKRVPRRYLPSFPQIVIWRCSGDDQGNPTRVSNAGVQSLRFWFVDKFNHTERFGIGDAAGFAGFGSPVANPLTVAGIDLAFVAT